MKDEALRYNEGKPRLGLIPPQIIEGLGHVLSFGAQKYDDNNWVVSMNETISLKDIKEIYKRQINGDYKRYEVEE